MKKFLSIMLCALMVSSCMSFTSFAQEGEMSADALTPILLPVNSAGAKDQKCTRSEVKDGMDRSVTKITPDASVSATGAISPACFADNIKDVSVKNIIKESNYAYKAIKFVYYTSGSSTNVPKLTVYVDNGNWAGSGTAATLASGSAS